MKNLIKKILILIPIGMLLVTGSVGAQGCYNGKVTYSIQHGRIRNIRYTIQGIHNGGVYSIFDLNGNASFCLNPGKAIGSEYIMQTTVPMSLATHGITATIVKKAYGYYERTGGELDRLYAQVAVWAAMLGRTTKEEIVDLMEQAVSTIVSDIYSGSLIRSSEDIVDDIWYGAETDKDLYIWQPSNGGNFQSFISPFYDDSTCGTPVQESCEIIIEDSARVYCSYNTFNDGYLVENTLETVPGACKYEYTDNRNNAYGKPESGTIGNYCKLYCLQSIKQRYPGNIDKAINVGRYIVWPNNNINNNSYKANANLTKYPLSLTLTKNCKLLVDNDSLKDDYDTIKNSLDAQGRQTLTYGGTAKSNYLNDGFSCNTLAARQNQAQIDYNNAVAAYNDCYERNKYQVCIYTYTYRGYTHSTTNPSFCDNKRNCTVSGPVCHYEIGNRCDSYARDRDNKQNKLTDATNDLTKCTTYASLYDQANSIIDSFNACVSANITNNLSFTASFSANYADPDYGNTTYEIRESSSNDYCNNCSSSIGTLIRRPDLINASDVEAKANEVNQRPKVEMNLTKTFDIIDGYYYYVDKLTNKSVHSLPNSNYSFVGFSNMPISYDSNLGDKYELKLSVNNLTGTSFDNVINAQDYTCYYKANNISTTCVCPEGTAYAGTSLDDRLANYNNNNTIKYTCSDAQTAWCDTQLPADNPQDYVCPNDSSIDLKPCINAGNNYSYCVQKYCTVSYVCPAGTTNEGMDLNACVIPMIEKGMGTSDAYNYCVDISCPYNGIKIIYRTISLQNPFPSYDADASISASSTLYARLTQINFSTGISRKGKFNTDVVGRYPGTNWNGEATVVGKILKNRNVNDDDVYNKAPLYTFVLDSTTLNAIRLYNDTKKANSGAGYADFSLSCKLDNSAACISSFVHSASYGLTGGTCSNIASNGSNFYTCDD